MEDKNNNLTYKKHDNTNEEVRFCEQVESKTLSPTIDNTDKKRSKSSNVSPREEVQTSSIVYNTEGCTSLEDLHNLYDEIKNLGS